MNKIVVPHPSGHLNLTLEQARQLAKDLNSAIAATERKAEGLRPPAQSRPGYLDRSDLYGFFAQLYPEPAHLRNHAGRLFATLVRFASRWYPHGWVEFEALCGKCEAYVRYGCGYEHTNRHFIRNDAPYFVEIASLKTHADEFLDGEWQQVGPSMKQDFKTLLSYL